MIQVPMHQARIPIRGGGGHIDLRERGGVNPIVAALERIIERKRQREQDELSRRFNETRIAQMQQPESMSGQVVVGGGKTWLVDRRTGQKKDLGIPAPKGKVEGKPIADIINAIAGISRAAQTIPEDVVDTPTIGRALRPLQDELKHQTGRPTPMRTPPKLDDFFRGETTRKKVESKEIPPKPKDYPDAKWSEEHQMWTVVRNGRLKGIK